MPDRACDHGRGPDLDRDRAQVRACANDWDHDRDHDCDRARDSDRDCDNDCDDDPNCDDDPVWIKTKVAIAT